MTHDNPPSSSKAPQPVIPYHGPSSRKPAKPSAGHEDDPFQTLPGESRLGWGLQMLCLAFAVIAFFVIWLIHRMTVV